MHRIHRCARARSGFAGFLAVLAFAAAAAHAQPFPSRPIEFIAHTSPGGGTDLFARTISDMLAKEKIFSQPFVGAAYKEYAERNLFENTWLGSAEFAEYLSKSRGETQEFLKALGLLK